MYSWVTMRRLEEDKDFDSSVIKKTKMRYRDFILLQLLTQKYHSQLGEVLSSTLVTVCAMDILLAAQDANNFS